MKIKNEKIKMSVSIPVLKEDDMFNHFKGIFDDMLKKGEMRKEIYDKQIALLIEETLKTI